MVDLLIGSPIYVLRPPLVETSVRSWAIYRVGWPRAVKRAASVYRTVEQGRIAGSQALREFLANIAKRKKKRTDR